MNNINPVTGIAYGYISTNALDGDIVQELQFGSQAKEPAYEAELASHLALKRAEHADTYRIGHDEFDEQAHIEAFSEDWQPDEPVHEGKIVIAGYPPNPVHYRTSWLGGALNVFIFMSPFTTDKARRASPCVPNAGILDTLDGDVTAYDVPADWRREPT